MHSFEREGHVLISAHRITRFSKLPIDGWLREVTHSDAATDLALIVVLLDENFEPFDGPKIGHAGEVHEF